MCTQSCCSVQTDLASLTVYVPFHCTQVLGAHFLHPSIQGQTLLLVTSGYLLSRPAVFPVEIRLHTQQAPDILCYLVLNSALHF